MKVFKEPVPDVGDKCTIYVGSDAYAGRVTRVSDSGNTVWITRDSSPNSIEKVFCNKHGEYRLSGECHWHVRFGIAENYRDPSF